MFAGTDGGGVYRSMDGGMSWTYTGLTAHVIFSIGFNSANHVFVGADNDGVFRSTDDGATWQQLPTGFEDRQVLSLVIAPSGSIFAGTYLGNIFRSTDGGENWMALNTGILSENILAMIVNAEGEIFASAANLSTHTGVGVYQSADDGDTWTQVNEGLVSTIIGSFGIISSGHLIAGSNASGVFRTVDPTTFIEYPSPNSMTLFSLFQSFPNPFNPATTIKYDLPTDSRVSLKVYDVLGREVLDLVDGVETAGQHEVVLNASELSSGVYFYRLKAGDFTDTKRFMLLK
jgi:photosystem II stability/assembly factor-like uncharacterized protein